ncbi:MAG: hypothetical protein IKF68_07495 [Erysipelotrichaceae bacterium]|nr:hypothetical protein [Erysipelotrichaceae bacterium]
MVNITLVPLSPADREQFILDNQEAFNYGALEEFGPCDDRYEEDEQIISRETIEQSINGGEADAKKHDGILELDLYGDGSMILYFAQEGADITAYEFISLEEAQEILNRE